MSRVSRGLINRLTRCGAGVVLVTGLAGGCAAGVLTRTSTASRAAERPVAVAPAGDAVAGHTSTPFQGVKANTGTATHRTTTDGRQVLALSDDFKIPDTPAPHWQVVDSGGSVYLLQQMRIKDGKTNRTITLPAYVKDVARVQVWCSYAEALLGEASFAPPVR